ncbi:MAG: c-type cytochrome [Anaerolineae bacterium]
MTTREEEPSVTQIVVIFVLLGAVAAVIPLAVNAFRDYIEVGILSDEAARESIAEVQGLEIEEEQGLLPAAQDEPEHPGYDIFLAAGCAGCHNLDTTELVGPGLGDIADRGGSILPDMDAETYVRTSIIDPCSYLSEGHDECLMPENYEDELTDEEIDNLVAFLVEGQE